MSKRFITLVLGLAVAGATVGCSRQKAEYDVTLPERKTLTQDGPTSTSHGGKLGDTVTKVEIAYATGEKGITWKRQDGTTRNVRQEYPDGSVKNEATFTDDGKEVQHGEVHRADGSLFMVYDRDPKGTKAATFFDTNSKKTLFREWAKSGGGFVDTYYRPADGSIIGKIVAVVADDQQQFGRSYPTNLSMEVFPYSNQPDHFMVEFLADAKTKYQVGQRVSYFTTGTDLVSYAQVWRNGWTNISTQMTLEQVEEFTGDGKTLSRTLFFKEDQQGHVFLLGSKKQEYTYGYPYGGGIYYEDRISAPGGNGNTDPPKYSMWEFRVNEKDDKMTEIQSWEREQFVWMPSGMPIKKKFTVRRMLSAGTAFKETKADGTKCEHKEEEEIRETINVDHLKLPKGTEELQQAQQNFQYSDKQFLGQPSTSDPCRWATLLGL